MSPCAGGPRRAYVRELCGRDELDANLRTPTSATRFAANLVVETPGAAVGPADIWALTLSDRDRILAAVYSSAFGHDVESVVTCETCTQAFEVRFSLDELVKSLQDRKDLEVQGPDADGIYALRDGRRFRLPTADDERAMAGMDPARAVAELVVRCTIDGQASEDLEALQAAMEQVGPNLEPRRSDPMRTVRGGAVGPLRSAFLPGLRAPKGAPLASPRGSSTRDRLSLELGRDPGDAPLAPPDVRGPGRSRATYPHRSRLVSYLSRVAARAAGRAVAPPMHASIGSASPLVAHDQRLNIPEFAAAPPPLTQAGSSGAAPMEGAETAPSIRPLPERTRVEHEVIVSESILEAATVASTPASAPQPAGTSAPLLSQRSSPIEPRDSVSPAEKTGRPEHARRSQYVDEHPDPIERAFAEANAWLRSPAAERRSNSRLEPTAPRAPAALREPPTRSAPAMNRSLERPSLTIGAIDVEVVAPPALPGVSTVKAAVRREPSPRGHSSGAPFGARPGFGWRQR